jgi:hypothetical protein
MTMFDMKAIKPEIDQFKENGISIDWVGLIPFLAGSDVSENVEIFMDILSTIPQDSVAFINEQFPTFDKIVSDYQAIQDTTNMIDYVLEFIYDLSTNSKYPFFICVSVEQDHSIYFLASTFEEIVSLTKQLTNDYFLSLD